MNSITLSYNDSISVDFTSDAYLNATSIAKSFNKRVQHYLDSDRTKEYINELGEYLKAVNPAFEENQIFVLKKGSPEAGGGTWLHPKLAIDFARWLSAKFAIWCDMQIEKILHPPQPALKPLSLKKTKTAVEGGLSLETQDEIKQIIQDRAALLPKDNQASFVISMWSALSTHFGIKKVKGDKIPAYKRIPEGSRLECLSLIARLSVDNLVTLTHEQFEEKINERIKALPSPIKEGEVLPKKAKDSRHVYFYSAEIIIDRECIAQHGIFNSPKAITSQHDLSDVRKAVIEQAKNDIDAISHRYSINEINLLKSGQCRRCIIRSMAAL